MVCVRPGLLHGLCDVKLGGALDDPVIDLVGLGRFARQRGQWLRGLDGRRYRQRLRRRFFGRPADLLDSGEALRFRRRVEAAASLVRSTALDGSRKSEFWFKLNMKIPDGRTIGSTRAPGGNRSPIDLLEGPSNRGGWAARIPGRYGRQPLYGPLYYGPGAY